MMFPGWLCHPQPQGEVAGAVEEDGNPLDEESLFACQLSRMGRLEVRFGSKRVTGDHW